MSSSTFRLHVAVKKGDEKKIKQYLKAGDDINAVDELGFTSLIIGISNQRVEIVQLLLETGADPSVQCPAGTALVAAASIGNMAILRALIRAGADINTGSSAKQVTPLMLSASAGHVAVVRLLIEEGCDIRKRSVSGATALYDGVTKGHVSIVEILLDAGADVNEVSLEGTSILAWAARSGKYHTALKLLERGAAIDVANSGGFTPLHFSASSGSCDITEVLLRARADPNKQTFEDRQTPLHLACVEGHPECAKLLLLAGANVSATDFLGRTPLHYVLVEPDGGNNQVIELLLSAGADLSLVDGEGNVPLFYAVKHGHAKVASLLLEAGSDVNRINKLGRNVLFISVDLEVVKLLLAKGADATVVDIFGYTVLYSAVFNNSSGGVICALYRAGADPTARSGDGCTAAEYAREKGYTETAKLLDLLEAKYRETRGSACNNVDSEDAKAAKMSAAAACMDKAKKIVDDREAEMGFQSVTRVLTMNDITNIVESLNVGDSACEGVKDSVEECKDDQQTSSALPCLNCEAMTSRRCSGCGISYFCSKRCELSARHLCCG